MSYYCHWYLTCNVSNRNSKKQFSTVINIAPPAVNYQEIQSHYSDHSVSSTERELFLGGRSLFGDLHHDPLDLCDLCDLRDLLVLPPRLSPFFVALRIPIWYLTLGRQHHIKKFPSINSSKLSLTTKIHVFEGETCLNFDELQLNPAIPHFKSNGNPLMTNEQYFFFPI